MDGRVQRRLVLTALRRVRLRPADLWIEYYALGGEATEFELEAYLNAALTLPAFERNLIADACNALLEHAPGAVKIPQSSEDDPAGTVEDSRKALGAAGSFLLSPAEIALERLDALSRTGLLDTPPETRFDRFTRQAIEQFGVSTAILTLVDDQRVFLKSVIGPLEQNLPLSVAFCTATIENVGPLVVPDTLADERFKDNILVTGEPYIRFYAGYPVRGPGQWAVGTICVIDQRPRSFSDRDRYVLRQLALGVETELAARR